MKITRLLSAAAAVAFLFATSGRLGAEVRLPAVIGDNMVLQQNAQVAIWGTAKPNSPVLVAPSWSKAKVVAMADGDGKFLARVHTPAAGGPYDIVFSDGDKATGKNGKLTVSNVLIGEVWICSGQSNMEMPMKGFSGQPVDGAAELIVTAKPKTAIRMCTVKKAMSVSPVDTCVASWQEHTPEAVAGCSAAAYYFGKRLNEVLEVPVGLLITDWGGTPIQSWMSEEVVKGQFNGEFDLSHLETGDLSDRKACQKPVVLYNAMINPIIPFTAKGFIWYQGEANRWNPEQYKRLQPAFVQMLRDKWDNQEMPFYFVQIAPYIYEGKDLPGAGYMMWAQAQTLEKIPHSGMATTLDIGNLHVIHPAAKKPVGDRLAYLALTNDYGLKGIVAQGPVAKTFDFKDGKAHVTFGSIPMGLSPINQELEGFELAGADSVWHPATACVCGNRVSIDVVSPEVPEPVAVRYAIRNWAVATLFNGFGIPASPFRSDDWK